MEQIGVIVRVKKGRNRIIMTNLGVNFTPIKKDRILEQKSNKELFLDKENINKFKTKTKKPNKKYFNFSALDENNILKCFQDILKKEKLEISKNNLDRQVLKFHNRIKVYKYSYFSLEENISSWILNDKKNTFNKILEPKKNTQ